MSQNPSNVSYSELQPFLKLLGIRIIVFAGDSQRAQLNAQLAFGRRERGRRAGTKFRRTGSGLVVVVWPGGWVGGGKAWPRQPPSRPAARGCTRDAPMPPEPEMPAEPSRTSSCRSNFKQRPGS